VCENRLYSVNKRGWHISSPSYNYGIKYIGSKKKLIPNILEIAQNLPLEDRSIIDVFTGTTRVAQAFRQIGYYVQASDMSYASQRYAETFLGNHDWVRITADIEFLNRLPGIPQWLTQHYSEHPCGVFQRKNTERADSIREYIHSQKNDDSVLVTSLIFALDAVDSSVGQHQAYLKSWSKRSYNDLYLKVPQLIDGLKGKFYLGNCLDINYEPASIAYLDPPYTAHNYKTYYHIWESIALWDKPDVGLTTNRRIDFIGDNTPKSKWNSKSTALEATEQLIKNLPVKWIIISYNDEGLIPKQDLFTFIEDNYRNISIHEVSYRRNIMSSIGNATINKKEGFKIENKEMLIVFQK